MWELALWFGHLSAKKLHWEQLIPHKPAKQLSDGIDVNLLLTGATFDADTDMKDWLSFLWLAELSSAFCTIFTANRKHVYMFYSSRSQCCDIFVWKKDTLDLCKLDPSQAWVCIAKTVDTDLIWSSQMIFTLSSIATFCF